MNEKLWKVKMIRLLTDKTAPDVIWESSFEYELPADYSSMLESFDHVDDVYKGSVLEGVNRLTCGSLNCTTFTLIDRGSRTARFPPHFRM